jgi:hypothetical protein
MALVHDQYIPTRDYHQTLCVCLVSGLVDARDNSLILQIRIRVVARCPSPETQAETRELSVNIVDKSGGRKVKNSQAGLFFEKLRNNQTSLNRLAESYLVGNQDPRQSWRVQNMSDKTSLVRQRLNLAGFESTLRIFAHEKPCKESGNRATGVSRPTVVLGKLQGEQFGGSWHRS